MSPSKCSQRAERSLARIISERKAAGLPPIDKALARLRRQRVREGRDDWVQERISIELVGRRPPFEDDPPVVAEMEIIALAAADDQIALAVSYAAGGRLDVAALRTVLGGRIPSGVWKLVRQERREIEAALAKDKVATRRVRKGVSEFLKDLVV